MAFCITPKLLLGLTKEIGESWSRLVDKKRILEACHSNRQGKTLWNMQITDQVATNMTFAVLVQMEFCLILLLGNLYFC